MKLSKIYVEVQSVEAYNSALLILELYSKKIHLNFAPNLIRDTVDIRLNPKFIFINKYNNLGVVSTRPHIFESYTEIAYQDLIKNY